MTVEMWAGVVALVVIPLLAALAARAVVLHASAITGSRVAGRVRRTLNAACFEFGVLVPAAVIVLAGLSLTTTIMWLLGRLAHALQGPIDWPVWHWLGAHQNQAWTNTWWHITNMGSPSNTQRLVIVGSVVLALVWRKKLWWLPPLTLCLGYIAEKYGQIILKLVVDRGHPPHAAVKFGAIAGTHGTWPSGGCARVLVVYGLIIYFAIRSYRSGRSSGLWVAGASLLSLSYTTEAYARLNNMEHWFTDVIGGAIFGVLLLAVLISGAEIVQRATSRRRAGDQASEAASRLPVSAPAP